MKPRVLVRIAGDRRGFSLAELAVVVMIVGILSGVALPNLRSALLRADATSVVADARTVALAAYEYLADNGSFPNGGTFGTPPPALDPYLGDGFDFEYKGMTYYWLGISLPSADNDFAARNLGIFVVNYESRPDMAAPFQAFQGGDAFWSQTMLYFIYPG